MASNELFAKMEGLWTEFQDNHSKFTEKGNKAAATRARKAVGELKKLVTEYRKASVAESKRSQTMASRLTNADLHNEIQLLKQDLDHVKAGQLKMQNDVSMIKKTLLDPDQGAIARVNRNTQFRKLAGGALWSVWVAMIGVLAKLIFWNQMKKSDLKNKLKTIVKEEVSSLLAERDYKYGGLLDPTDFDPVDPEVHIIGFGSMTRSALRQEIVRRLQGALKTAKDAATGGSNSYDKFKSLEGVLEPNGVLQQQLKAEREISQQMEELRSQGGRRAIPIPKQK